MAETPIGDRMAALLDRMAFGMEVAAGLLPTEPRHENQPRYPLSTQETLLPSALLLADEARALIEEYRRGS